MNGHDTELRRTSAWIGFGALLAAAILLSATTFFPLWEPLLLAAVLASATHGAHERLVRGLRGRRYAAAGVMTVAVVVAVLLPLSVLATVAIREGIEAVAYVREALRQGGVEELASRLPDRIEGPLRRIVERLDLEAAQISPGAAASGGAAVAARIAGDVLAGISRLFFSLAMLLIAYFALLADGHRLLDWFEDVSPLRGRQTRELFAEFRKVSRSVLGSTIVTAAAQAIVAGIGYRIAGIPNPVFFAVLTFFTAFIPSVGTAVVALPLAGLLLLFDQIGHGIFLAAWGLFVVGLVDNLLKPILIRGGVQLHGVIVFFSLVGGILVFGATGLVVGPLAVTFLLTMIRFGYRDFSPREVAAPGSADEIPIPARPGDVPPG